MTGGGDDGLDLAGLGKLAKAVPAPVWKRAAETACVTFEKAVAPLTETTSGMGRLIAARFDRLTELEKINAAAAVKAAGAKIKAAGKIASAPSQAKVIVAAIEGAGMETDGELRELWANLIASEFTGGRVHPQIPKILAQMTADDAKTLSIIHRAGGMSVIATFPRKYPVKTERLNVTEPVSHSALVAIGVIRSEGSMWVLTPLGEAFVEAVEGPKRAQLGRPPKAGEG